MRFVILAAIVIAFPSTGSARDETSFKECVRLMIHDELTTHVCHIHHLRLREVSLAVDETFPQTPENDAFHRAQACHFPHAWFFGTNSHTDLIEVPPPTHRDALVCTACRRAQREWAIAHPNTKWSRFILAHPDV